jgi:IPT/TIG domain/Bacterial TSP3 repeat
VVVSNQIDSMMAGQTNSYTRPVELITLGILTASPTISSVNAGCGGTAGGTALTITGNNFIPGSTVTIGGVAATSVVFSNVNTLTAITPPGAAGPQTVAVKSPSASVPGTRANGFTYTTPVSFGGVSNVAPAIEAATLTWSAATGTGVTYRVFEGTASGLENFGSPVATTTNLSALVAPLYPGSNAPISYYFVVRASDVCGNSESNVVEQSVQPLLDPDKDQDGDGLPNWFEQLYGLNPFDATDAGIDSDGDGFTNLQEYLAGTNPLDPSSRFRILSVVADPSGDIVTWSASSNKIYQLQLDLDLASAIWSNVGATVTDDVGQLTLSQTNLVDPSILDRFYRVLLSQ